MGKGKKKTNKRTKKGPNDSDSIPLDQDENFYFIAGYTDGGFAFGITWEEQAEIERKVRERELHYATKRSLELPEVQLRKIVDVMNRPYDEFAVAYLNVRMGNVFTINELDGDEEDERLRCLVEGEDRLDFEPIPSLDWMQRMGDLFDFANTVQDEVLKKKLKAVLESGRKRNQRFRSLVKSSNPEEYIRLTDFLQMCDRERAIEWLRSIGIELRLLEDVTGANRQEDGNLPTPI
ncbi:hypothetical protein J19TS2_59010 [Cohnella xylanilytica]|uniref:UPF0158 family protein n=1 Tax=Cohnella xylanilytica TaxID=557555 RepID=UPI001B1FE185|nr:UPF0158 family protein [Cohnella xylanilytica]GIO16346.1 hypothetical protein J19TS2_59010 [Cohnella xylanilytica]